MTDQTNISTNDVNVQSNINVGTAGHSQQVVATPTDNNVAQSGPNEAFAELRRQNESLQRQAAIAQDPEVVAFLQQREAAKKAAEAARLQQPTEIANEIAQIKAWQAQQQQASYEAQLASNRETFKSTYQMDDNAYAAFIQQVATRFDKNGEVSRMLEANPAFDLSPYLAAVYPDKYASFMAMKSGATQAPAQPVFVPGHTNGNQTPAVDQALSDRIAARIKNY